MCPGRQPGIACSVGRASHRGLRRVPSRGGSPGTAAMVRYTRVCGAWPRTQRGVRALVDAHRHALSYPCAEQGTASDVAATVLRIGRYGCAMPVTTTLRASEMGSRFRPRAGWPRRPCPSTGPVPCPGSTAPDVPASGASHCVCLSGQARGIPARRRCHCMCRDDVYGRGAHDRTTGRDLGWASVAHRDRAVVDRPASTERRVPEGVDQPWR